MTSITMQETQDEIFEREYFEQQEANRLERYHIREGYKQDPLYQVYTKAYNERYEVLEKKK